MDKTYRQLLSIVSAFSLLLQTLSPFVYLSPKVLAQEATSTPAVTETPTPTAAPTETVTPTQTPTPTETLTPTPTVEVSPTVVVTPLATPTATPEATLTPTEAPSVPSPPDNPTATPSKEQGQILDGAATQALATPNKPGRVETTVIDSFSCRADSLNGCLTTDKADYAPTEAAVISGYGFAPDTIYTLYIYSNDLSVSYQITTDSQGAFTYSYQLDGTYRPNYSVELKDISGIVVATTSFTDSHEDYKHWSDKAPSPSWQNGALQGSNSQYFEGEVVPHWWITEGLTVNSTYGFNIYYDNYWNSGSYCGFDYLAQYNTSRSPSFVGSAPISDDVFSEGHGNFYTVGADILSVSSPVTSGVQKYVQVKFKATATSAEFYWGLHMAVSGAVSGCAGAHSWPGASLQTNVDNTPSISGASMRGGGGSLQINPNGIIQGLISGYKWNDLNNNGIFDSEPKLSGWTIRLCNDASCTSVLQTTVTDGSGNYSFSVIPGTYYVGEVQQSGWSKTYPTGSTYGPLTINATTPTFSNQNFGNYQAPTTGTLTIHKVDQNGDPMSGVTVQVTGPSNPASQQTNASGDAIFTGLNIGGPYTINVTEPVGYHFTSVDSPCTGTDPTNLSLASLTASGATCTVRDARNTGTITVNKIVSGGTAVASDFCFTLSPDPGIGQVCAVGSGTTGTATFSDVPAGTYSANETKTISGYSTVSNCSNLVIANNGDTASCDYYNNRDKGDLKAKKVVDDVSDLTQWKFSMDGGTAISADSLGVVDFGQVTTLDTHTITESGPDGYHLVSITGTNCTQSPTNALSANATVTKNGTTTCTFTNNRDKGSLTVHKLIDTNGDGTFETSDSGANTLGFRWGLDTPTPANSFGIGVDLATDDYSLSEKSVTDYHFVGWFNNSDTGKNCGNLNGTTLPTIVSISKGVTTTITLCNARDTGTVVVHKDVVAPNGSAVIDTSHTFGVSLDGANEKTLTDGESVTYYNVPTGSHAVTESTIPADYTLNSITPDADGGVTGAQITVVYGQTTEVYVVNKQQNATITIQKNVINPDGSEVADSHSFTVQKDGGSDQTIAEGTNATYSVAPGTYTFTEVTDGGYSLDSITGDNDINPANGATVTVASSGSASLTFVNKQKKGIITVVKSMLDPDGNPVRDLHSFTVQLNSGNDKSLAVDTNAVYSVNPGTYSITELPDGNYDELGCKLPTGGDATEFTITSNQPLTITCTNQQKKAVISVDKNVLAPDGVTDVSDNHLFSVTLNGESQNFGEGSNASFTVNPGTYGATEGPDGDYILVSNDGPATVSSSGSATIHIVNKQKTATINVVKNVLNPEGVDISDDHSFTVQLSGTNDKTVSENSPTSYPVDPGTYTIGELDDSLYSELGCKLVSGAPATNFAIESNKEITVTCTNQQQYAHITVEKSVVDLIDNPVDDAYGIFTFHIGGQQTSLQDGQSYEFELAPGIYPLTEDGNADYTFVGCDTGLPLSVAQGVSLTVNSGDSFTVVCTNKQKPITISGYKFEDSDGDIMTTGDQNPVKDWSIQLYEWVNGVWNWFGGTLTDASGFFNFLNLKQGNYEVREVVPDDWKALSPTGIPVNVNPNDNNQNNNFVNFKLGKITACKYNDYNGNGQYEPQDDHPLANISIKLSQSTNLIGSKQTGENGCVTFDNLAAGQYRVEEDYTDPDLNGYYSTNGITNYDVSITSGSNETRIFLNTQYRTISGTKYNDLNNNGQRDAGEAGLENWKIFIDTNNNGSLDPGEKSVVTDANGYYEFTNLVSDSYTIVEELKPGWTQTEPTAGHYNVDVHTVVTSTGNDFGNFKLGVIQSRKYEDKNGNSVWNTGENWLSDWTIRLYNGEWQKVDEKITGHTGTLGQYRFEGLQKGTYYLCEVLKSGWSQTDPGPTEGYANQSVQSDEAPRCRRVIISQSGQQSIGEKHFGNQGRGTITVNKNVDTDGDGKVDIYGATDWTWDITNGEQNISTGQERTLAADSYTISEDQKENYHVTNLSCTGDEEGRGAIESARVILNPGDNTTCTFTNTRDTGSITVNKKVDSDGDYIYEGGNDEANTLGFKWGTESASLVNNMGTTVSGLPTGDYNVYENLAPGYHLVGWFVGDGVCEKSKLNTTLPAQVPVGRDGTTITLCNRFTPPTLTLTKSNDASGDKSPGDSVGYTLTLNILGNSLKNLLVTDLLPKGFKYHAGSWKVIVGGFDRTSDVTEPEYHSPGVWNLTGLGTLPAGTIVELQYTADIDGSQQYGLYKDLAWAKGKSLGCSNNIVMANATSDPAYFVGTQVNVNGQQQSSTSVNIGKEGQVLGATTELPATGGKTIWMILASLLIVLGTLSVMIGISLKRKNKFLKKLIGNLFAVVFLTLALTTGVHADFNVRLQQPKSPTYLKDFTLTYVVLDNAASPGPITVRCYKKGPSDGGYSQFGSDISVDAGGNTGTCSVDGTIVNPDGTYSFYVTANGVASNTVSVEYNAGGPSTPQSYSKEQTDSCHYKINFRTADDSGKTVKVELYRSTNTSFSADNGSRANEVNIGSSSDGSFTDNVSDCNKTWYYVIRAFDKFGNGSGIIGDSVVTSTMTITPTPGAGGAIPVSAGNIPAQGQTLGAKTGTEEGSVLGATPSAKPEVVETANPAKKISKKNIFIVGLGIIIIAAIAYVIYRKKTSSTA